MADPAQDGMDRPAPPDWLQGCLDADHRAWRGEVCGARLHARIWDGPASGPYVLLVHGGAAHAGWWDVIAPLLSGSTVVALDLSGHGDSQWRERYSFPVWAQEVVDVAEAIRPQGRPVLVGHSLGGIIAAMAAERGGDDVAGLIMVDSPLRRPRRETISDADAVFGAPKRYSSAAAAWSRFRILPEQPALHRSLLDHVARASVCEFDGAWSWKFDPRAFAVDPDDRPSDVGEVLSRVSAPVSAVIGELSGIVPSDERERLRELVTPLHRGVTVLAGGHHHLMFDRPRELADVLATTARQYHDTSADRAGGVVSVGSPERGEGSGNLEMGATVKTVDTTLFGLLERAVEAYPDRDAVVFPETRVSYRELGERVEYRARILASLGVQPGEHVGTIMPNGLDTIEFLLAISALGAVPVPFNPRFRGEELAYVVDHADVVTLLVRGEVAEGLDFAARLSEALPELDEVVDPTSLGLDAAPALRRIALLGEGDRSGMISLEALDRPAVAGDSLPLYRADTGDIGLMMYTSGTTARPKGALLSHRPFVLGGQALADRYELTFEDRLFDPLPLFHMAGILGLAASLSRGASFLCMSKIEGGPSLEMMVRERATVGFIGFPTLALSMIEHRDFDADGLPDLRLMHTHGLPEVLRKIQRAVPQAVVQNPYGCTEAGGLVSLSELSDSLDERVTYSGRPYPGVEVSVVAPTGEHLDPGQRGELVVRGWSLFEGYYRNPEATAAVVDDDGWFHTGDLGELDADGRLKYVSRLKDMLKVGGENVAAAEIEDLLSEHPAASVVQVIGIPDQRLDEVPAAFVELVPGAQATEEDLLAFCEGRIASFKVPRLVRIVDSWPMSATKIQKFRLKEQLLAELGDGLSP